jgi:hypothetical protein
MEKEKDIVCKGCGRQLEKEHYENDNGEMFFPVIYFPTIEDCDKYYKEEITGESYYKTTGIKPQEVFHKGMIRLTHLSMDDDYNDETSELHTFGEVECWIND